MSDPFSMTFSALWELAIKHEPLSNLIKLANRVRFDDATNRNPIKKTAAASDHPELILISEGTGTINMRSSSCSSMIVRRYAWIINTGDLRVNHILNPVEWALFCAMNAWPNVLRELEWKNQKFIKRVGLIEVQHGRLDNERITGLIGWSAVWRCEVEMHFPTADLTGA